MDAGDPTVWRWIWLVAAVVFGVGEMTTAGSFFLAPFALGAAVAAVLAFVGVELGPEWIAFIGVSIITFLALRPLAHRMDARSDHAGIGSRRLIGQPARVITAIGGDRGAGMVLLGAEQWRAESLDGSPIAVDTEVMVTEVRGTRVVVRPQTASESPSESVDDPST